jgi:CubicO group peptidase (beta-lactamase class C family)
MKIIKIVLGSLLALVFVAVLALWLKPPALLRIGSNYTAKIVCSNVFLAERDPDAVLRDDVQAPGISILRYMKVSVDRDARVVHAGFFGFIGDGVAVARPGVGCTVVPDGNVNFAKAVAPSSSAATPKAEGPSQSARPAHAWPDGETAAENTPVEKIIADDKLAGPGMRAVVVIDHGHLVAERYGTGFSPTTPLLGWSMSKTVMAGVIGMLVKDGKLTLDQAGFWPPGDPRANIRIADLLAMSSGLHFNESYGAVSDVTSMLYLQSDMAAFAHDQPLEHPVGEAWSYSSGTAVLLSRIMQDAAGQNSADFVSQRLFQPLGMNSATMEADEHGTLVGSSYMYANAHDWARYGQFLVQDGVWKDQRMLPEGYVAMMATPVKASGGEYGMGQTWLFTANEAAGIPPDTFYLSGHDGQTVAVIRSRQLVIVRMGLTPNTTGYSPQPLIKAILSAT